jgi:hypothetical protein
MSWDGHEVREIRDGVLNHLKNLRALKTQWENERR